MVKAKSKKKSTTTGPGSSANQFRYSTTSGKLLPLQTIQQRIENFRESLTWPACVKVLKANIAVTIALGLLLINSIRNLTTVGGILASVAVEFVHPTKSYGFLAEDVLFGAIMCCVSAAWSILAIYCAFLARDPNDPTLAQRGECAILSFFLIVGCFFLTLFRAKVEQANVGGMLSGTIMVICITTAVQSTLFTVETVLQVWLPTLVGFSLIFIVFLLIFPENSTRVFIQHLIKACETFDGIIQHQVSAFLKVENGPTVESLAMIHQTVDTLITTLIQRKCMVKREPSFNAISPADVGELTSIIKRLSTPLQGIGLSLAMEENMQEAGRSPFQTSSDDETIVTHLFNRPRSYYGGTDDESSEGLDDCDEAVAPTTTDEKFTPILLSTTQPSLSSPNLSVTSYRHDSSGSPDQQPRLRKTQTRLRWEDSMKVMTYWREDYDDVLNRVKPLYLELTEACSIAVKESVKRLRRIQDLDARFQNRPFFYKYYYRWRKGSQKEKEERLEYEYDPSLDPSIPLLKAIERFLQHRLDGLDRLYTKSGVPRRILFLLLTFQFNLHAYAEQIYTLTSFIYEMDKTRTKKRFWIPHMPPCKWFFQSHIMEENIELDTPGAVAEAVNSSLTLQRTLSRTISINVMNDLSQQQEEIMQEPTTIYKINTLRRGEIHENEERQLHHHRRHHHLSNSSSGSTIATTMSKFWNAWKTPVNPLEYHDPDVAYPTTSTQRFFYSMYLFCKEHFYTADVGFAFRAAFAVAFLTLPGFLETTVNWYNNVRGQWAAVVALIWMGPSVGSNFFGTMTRTVGTFIGAVGGIVIWEISRGTAAGLIILTFIFNLPWWLVYINGKFWKATGLFSLITVSLIVGYTYSFKPNGHSFSVYQIALERTVSVIIGVFSALILSVFPFPRTGRVILRHRISQTLKGIATLYASFLTLVFKVKEEDETTRIENQKLFRAVAQSIRQQIKGERVLLDQSRFEPALRGIFPENKYLQILQILDNILSLMLEMEFSFSKIPSQWRLEIVRDTWKERKIMTSSFLTALHLGSNALSNKSPLPPYVIRPTKARRKLTNKARKAPAMSLKHLGDREYTYFSTYLMNSEQLAVEIELLNVIIRDLVGPDSVSIWLDYKH
ncbi:uncharacterized protein BX663DRAFT_503657 [Cokeromyces recurvatus]|uniref:uncharacterized protein n=1 Tax=Cokeromyces recurvatus TaxID=90255 RepID=UPI002220B4FB|nr:uncharacterized protein BX663DRAFT_503657 [Cokeromyces recurvatus]KAI7904812.1 hypothetical protein BX663DRAFT_503657 [Cokeromyces recurvatus]